MVYRTSKTSNLTRTVEKHEKVEIWDLISLTYETSRQNYSTHRKPVHIGGEWTQNAHFLYSH